MTEYLFHFIRITHTCHYHLKFYQKDCIDEMIINDKNVAMLVATKPLFKPSIIQRINTSQTSSIWVSRQRYCNFQYVEGFEEYVQQEFLPSLGGKYNSDYPFISSSQDCESLSCCPYYSVDWE